MHVFSLGDGTMCLLFKSTPITPQALSGTPLSLEAGGSGAAV